MLKYKKNIICFTFAIIFLLFSVLTDCNSVYASGNKFIDDFMSEADKAGWKILDGIYGIGNWMSRTIPYFKEASNGFYEPKYDPSAGIVGTHAKNIVVVNSHGGGGASRIPYDDESTYTHGGGGSSRPDTSHGGGGHSRPGTSSGGTTTIPSTDQSVSGSTTNTYNSFSLVKNESVYNTTTNSYENKSYIYSPVTKTYNTVNKITYAPSYTTVNNTTNNYNNYTYNFQTNNYNYYVTNNYTYVSYYITPASADTITGDGTDKSDDTYLELYYELPDGRNSYDLKAEDVWGQYNIYNVVGYESVAEDAGTTLALLHLDSDLKDSSYFKNASATGVSNVYTDGAFKECKTLRGGNDYIQLSLNQSLGSSWTIEFFLCPLTGGTTNAGGMFGGIIVGNINYYFSNPQYLGTCFKSWTHIAFCYDGSMSAYVNGKKVPLSQRNRTVAGDSYLHGGVYVDGNTIYFGGYPVPYYNTVSNSMVNGYRGGADYYDEIRVSSRVVYDSEFAVPMQPFDTNQVLCVPSSASEHDIAVKGEYKISDYRIGGVRPTYPANGYVYISLEDDKVTSIQQYQSDGWYEVDAAIYEDGEWYKLKGFDMKAASFDTPSEDDPKDPDKPNDPDKPDNPDKPDKPPDSTVSGNGGGESGGIWDSIKNLGGSVVGFILKILEIGLDLLTKFVNGITSLLAPIEDMITSLLGFTESFSGFLSSMLLFVPDEIISVLVIGLTLMVILAVIKFIRG